jgi:galactan endo-1,6-beta-galactosidase
VAFLRAFRICGLFLVGALAACGSDPVDTSAAQSNAATADPGGPPGSAYDPTDATGLALTGAGYTVSVDTGGARGAWEGWGASLAWWGKAVGGSDLESLYADLVFTEKNVSFLGQTLPGLGLNIVRYNVGGGGRAGDVADLAPNVPADLPWYKDIEGYWRNWDRTDPASTSWDWTRDANQRSMLAAAKARGVTIELFSNAPMWWMDDSKSSAGGRLQSWNRRDHTRYLASVVKRAREAWGLDVGSIEPFNEPSAGWWTYPKGQEGCNIPKEEQKEVLGYLQEELHARGLDDVAITASDENTMTQALASYEYFDSQGMADAIGKVNVHGYSGLDPWRDNAARKRLREAVGNKRLWMSEYGDSDGSGMALAQTITEDLVNLRPSAWIYWQPVEPFSAWGFVNANYPADANGADRVTPKWVYTKYYVMAQFTRFIRPGQMLYGTTDHNTVAAFDAANGSLSLVTVNYGNAQRIVYDFSNVAADADVEVTVTNTAGTRLFQTGHAHLQDGKWTLAAEKNSIYSVKITTKSLR